MSAAVQAPVLRVALVGCGSRKRDVASPARELYTGSLFRAAIAHAEATADRVWIVSAQHGLVAPTKMIAPYEMLLSKSGGALNVWADLVVRDLLAELGAQTFTVQVFAGARYAEPIALRLAMSRVPVALPLSRLTQGARLAWFARERRARKAGGLR